jgi:hypothetical protein
MLEVSHTEFSYNPVSKVFVAEHSTLAKPLSERILLKGKTASVVYHFTHTEKDRDDDIVAWHYWPCAVSEGQIPACRGTKLVVMND